MSLNPWSFLLSPIHGTNVKGGVFIEMLDSLPRQADPLLGRDRRLQEEFLCGVIDSSAVEVEIGSNSFKRPRAIEHHGAKPGSMRAWAHDADVALVPFTFEEGPRS